MRWIVLFLWSFGLGLAGCSPAFNWRDIRLDEAPLTALLPCKPDRGNRTVPLAGASVELRMVGCEAGGATFAVSQTRLHPGAPAAEALAQWRAATLGNMRARDVLQKPFQPPGSLALPQSVQLTASGQRADGRPVQARAVWFARPAPEGIWLFHAVVYADAVDAEAADTFFGGLRLLGVP